MIFKLSLLLFSVACRCSFNKIGDGVIKKSRKQQIQVDATIFGNFCANFPKPSKQTINSGICAKINLWLWFELIFSVKRPHKLSAPKKCLVVLQEKNANKKINNQSAKKTIVMGAKKKTKTTTLIHLSWTQGHVAKLNNYNPHPL